jgi:hypothetical protein
VIVVRDKESLPYILSSIACALDACTCTTRYQYVNRILIIYITVSHDQIFDRMWCLEKCCATGQRHISPYNSRLLVTSLNSIVVYIYQTIPKKRHTQTLHVTHLLTLRLKATLFRSKNLWTQKDQTARQRKRTTKRRSHVSIISARV